MTKKPKRKEKIFLVNILHNHNGEFALTMGKIKAKNTRDALKRSRTWIDKKVENCECKKYGDNCALNVRGAYAGLKSTVMACSAEEIEIF